MMPLLLAAGRMFASLMRLKIPAPVVLAIVLALTAPLLMAQGKLASRAHEIHSLDDKVAGLNATLQASVADLAACRANREDLSAALAQQSRAVEAAAFQARAKIAAAEAVAIKAQAGRAQAVASAGRLMLLGGDTCPDFKAADAALLGTLP